MPVKMLAPRLATPKSRQGWSDRRTSRHARGYGAAWDKARERVLTRDCGICQPCKRHGILHEGHEVDHIVPKDQGGGDDDSNLQTICTEVHKAKTQAERMGQAWDEGQWFAGRGGLKSEAK